MTTHRTETILSLIALASLLLGPGFLFLGLRAYWISHGSEQWPQTTGTVIYSQVAESFMVEERFPLLSLKYEFFVASKRYESNQIYFQTNTGESHTYPAKEAWKYPLGKTVTVYYQPEDPQVAVLVPGTSRNVWGLLVPGALMTGTYLVLAMRDLRQRWVKRARP